MPSSPKIPKEMILEYALRILIREGYGALNIKSLAKEIGCSTQPISWHFLNMEGLRAGLGKYALDYANRKMCPASEGMQAFTEVGRAYIDIAVDEPNLFKYLYMSPDSGCFLGGLDGITGEADNAVLVKQVAEHFEVSEKKADEFCRNMIVYTHGIASFAAAGLITADRQEIYEMMSRASGAFLLQIGVNTMQDLQK